MNKKGDSKKLKSNDLILLIQFVTPGAVLNMLCKSSRYAFVRGRQKLLEGTETKNQVNQPVPSSSQFCLLELAYRDGVEANEETNVSQFSSRYAFVRGTQSYSKG